MNSTFLKYSIRAFLAAGVLATATSVSFAQTQNDDAKKAEAATEIKQSVVPSKDEKALGTQTTGDKVAINLTEATKIPAAVPVAESINDRPTAPTKQTTSDGWHVAMAPYLYVTGLNGTVGARGRTIEIDLSFADVMSSFKVGFMGAIEARKNRFVLVNDIIWLRQGEERTNTPPSAFSSSDIKVKTFIWDSKAGYRVVEGKGGFLDLLGGMRLMSIENELNTTTGLLPGFNVSQRKTWATPIGGVHGTANVTEKVFLTTLFDIGGGWGSDITLQAYGGMGYRIKPNIHLLGGWRYMKTDYNDPTGFVFDTTMNGLIIGARIQLK